MSTPISAYETATGVLLKHPILRKLDRLSKKPKKFKKLARFLRKNPKRPKRALDYLKQQGVIDKDTRDWLLEMWGGQFSELADQFRRASRRVRRKGPHLSCWVLAGCIDEGDPPRLVFHRGSDRVFLFFIVPGIWVEPFSYKLTQRTDITTLQEVVAIHERLGRFIRNVEERAGAPIPRP